MPNNNRKKPNLTQEQIRRLIQALLLDSSENDGVRVPARGAIKRVSEEFRLSRMQVHRLWKKALKNHQATGIYSATPTKQGNSGRRPVYDQDELAEALEGLPMEQRGSIRSIAEALGISVGRVHKLIHREHVIVPHNNSI